MDSITSTTIVAASRFPRDAMMRNPNWYRQDLFGVIPMPIVWNFITILLVGLIFWWLIRGSHKSEDAIDVLKKRYATGEIDRETFEQMKKDLIE